MAMLSAAHQHAEQQANGHTTRLHHAWLDTCTQAQHSTAQHAWSWSWSWSCVAYHAAQSHHAARYPCTMGAAWPVLAYIGQSRIQPLNAYTCTMHTDTHTTDKSAPMTASQRVIKANKALLARGGKRMPGGYLQPGTAQALADLVASGYAPSPLAAIVAALHDAHKKVKR